MTSYNRHRNKIENRYPIAKDGLPFILSGAIIAVTLYFAGLWYASILMGIASLFAVYFFRDPERRGNAPENGVLSPADGRIIDVRHMDDGNNPIGEPAIKVSIFMSLFNVHVNRIPVSGKVAKIVYYPGRFFSANMDKASEQNENNRITIDGGGGRRIAFVQIAGLIARRIACWIKEEDFVKAGQRFGLIRFGSRLDVYLPAGSRLIVRQRERVKAGETVIGYLP
jgi:phosphatidylserine decarboxylase